MQERIATDHETIIAVNKRDWTHPRMGGAETHLREILPRLASSGHEVHLVCGRFPGSDRNETLQGVKIHRFGPETSIEPPWDVVMLHLIGELFVHRWLRKLDPDVMLTINTPLPWFVSGARELAVFHHLGLGAYFDTHPFPQSLLGYLADRISLVTKRSTPALSVSPSTTTDLIEGGHDPDTIYEVPNGIDHENYDYRVPTENPRVVFIGALDQYKGADRLPAIHEAVEKRMGRRVRLDIAGRSGPEEGAVVDYCERTPSARYHGYVSESTKRELLSRGWLLIAPSRVEGWGISVIEANASGTPAIGTDVKGLRDSIDDGTTGILVADGDISEFATRIEHVLTDSKLRRELAHNAYTWSRNYSWERSALEVERAIQTVCSSER